MGCILLDRATSAAHTSRMTSPDPYTPPSYRGALLMLVLSLVGVVFVWLAYSAAMNTDFGRSVDIPDAGPVITAEPSAS